MSNDIVKSEQTSVQRIEFSELERMATVMAKSKILGNWDTPEKILTIMMIAQSEDCNPMQAIFRYDPIPCKAGVMARKKPIAMLTDFQRRGGKLKWLVTTPQEAKGEFTMVGRDTLIFSYTWQQAVRAGLSGKDNWSKNPDDMLRWQVVGRGLRVFDPASTGLMYTQYDIPDELDDITTNAPIEKTTVTSEPVPKQEEASKPELFGTAKKSAGRPKKVEEKVVEATVVEETKVVEPIKETIVEKAMEQATIPPVVPTSEPVIEESEYTKLIKTVDQDKLRGTLIALKYLTQNESFDKVSVPRQQGIVKQWDKFKAKVDNFVAFGTEVK